MKKPNTYYRALSCSSLATAVISLWGANTYAQDEAEVMNLEEIVVTGSLIKRSSFEGATPLQVVDRGAIDASGATKIKDIAMSLPVNSGSELTAEFGDLTGTTQFNIRGLGLSSSLTLINGRRAGTAPVGDANGAAFFDINTLPLAMIERIEVLTDGASATYGSEAVAGVANIITRKGFEGLELSGEYRDASNTSTSINLAAGLVGDATKFSIYGSYYRQSRNLRSDFDWLNERINGNGDITQSRLISSTGSPGSYLPVDLSADGSPTLRTQDIGGSAIATIPDPNCEAAGGVLRSATDSRCRFIFTDQLSVIPEEERIQLFTEFDWAVSDRITLFAEAGFSRNIVRRTHGPSNYRNGTAEGAIFIPADHPFNFFVQDPSDADRVVWVDPDQWNNSVHTAVPVASISRPLGNEFNGDNAPDFRIALDSFRIVEGAEFDISDTWSGSVAHQFATSQRSAGGPWNYIADTFNQLVVDGDWNPFGTRLSDPELVSPKDGVSVAGNSDATLALFNATSNEYAKSVQHTIDAIFTGSLFDLPAGQVGIAIGSQYRYDSLKVIPDSLSAAGEGPSPATSPTIVGSQDVVSVFSELAVPVFSNLELQLALRNESYGGSVGNTTDPKIAARWQPTEWLGVRASWGTSFQAPSIRQTAEASQSVVLDDPASVNPSTGALECVDRGVTNTTTFKVKGGDDLKPQNAKNYNVGFLFQPGNGFRFGVDYWNFDYTNLITQQEGAQAILDNDCADDGVVNDPRVVRDSGGQVRLVNSSFINTGSVKTDGLDFNLSYNFDTDTLGAFNLTSTISYVNKFNVQTTDNSAVFSGVGNRNFRNQFRSMPRWRGNVGLGWFNDTHSANIFVRYISGYDNDQPTEPARISSFATVDMQYSIALLELLGEETVITIGANNLFDVDPPSLGAGIRPAYDSVVHDVRGRQLYIRFKQSF